MSFLTRAASGGVVGGASSLSTAGSIAYVASAGVLGQDPTFARSNPGRYTLYDNTPTTGVTTFSIRAGAGQGSAVLQEWLSSAGSVAASLSAAGNFTSGGNIVAGAGGAIGFVGRGGVVATGDGIFRFANNAASDINRICLGGVTAAFPALKRNGTAVELRLADDSDQAPIMIASQTPASAAATGAAGTIAWDSSYIYVCTAANTWKRVAIATW